MLKVGELAQRAGLTVRTLHHYDSIGLLRPSARSDGGYRLYDRDDVARLQQIQALRKFGMALADIGAYLDSERASPLAIIEQQLAMLDREIDEATRMREQLLLVRAQLVNGEAPELSTWLTTLEQMTMYDKYFSKQDMEQLRGFVSDATQAQWAALVADVQALMDRGGAPESPEAIALGIRWSELLERSTGGNLDLVHKLDNMHQSEPSVQSASGITQELRAFILRAMNEHKLALYAKYLPPDAVAQMRRHQQGRAREWLPLISRIKEQMAADPSPATRQARQLAREWSALLVDMLGPDPATMPLFREAIQSEPALRQGRAMTDEMIPYLIAARQQG
ncbi:MerR family transcriptional regulator [Massilia terrae]|uniref:MerR family transcriptional regulator n=1 Tax=Massilia terrae TaxID=1811224 RepID=A0ABT2D1L9_9BURK|nr:MerR family transcriptional regulator [Massilia terrae]MCS0659935.1 MerR family transcriptional regulator [Massilia terrae]